VSPIKFKPSPVEFFDAVTASFESVTESNDCCDQIIHLAGSIIRLRFATTYLQKLLGRSFEHLSCDVDESPDLTINVWDSISTGAKMPAPPWSNDDYLARGEIRGYNDDRIRTAFILGETAGLNMLDMHRGQALFWVKDAHSIPYYETGAPLRTIMYWWHCSRGYQVVHSGAIGFSDGGVLLVGRGGSGKSTSCLACLGSELKYAADDYCIVATSPNPHVFSLYSTAKLKGALDLTRFPDLAGYVSNSERVGEEKALFFLHEHLPNSIINNFPLRALLIPSVKVDSDAYVERISSAQGLASLAPSSIFQNSGASHSEFRALSEIVRTLPCYRLVVGEKISQIPETITSLLKGLKDKLDGR